MQWFFKQSVMNYKQGKGYQVLVLEKEKVHWDKYTYARSIIPKQRVILWMIYWDRLPLKSIMARFMSIFNECLLCEDGVEENRDNLFFTCSRAQ